MNEVTTIYPETRTLSKTNGEVDKQIATAKAYPRDIEKSLREAIFLATTDEETAASCCYCLFRKSKDGKTTEIKGPSIRLAEIMTFAWGNIHAKKRIVSDDGRSITAEGGAWDLEKNLCVISEHKRSIINKDGKSFTHDMKITTGNAASSIAYRNAVFSVIPKVFFDRVYKAAIACAVGTQESLSSKRKKVFDRFTALGIQQERIFTFFSKTKIDDFNLEDMERLIGIGTAIKEGTLKLEDAFIFDEDDHDDKKIKKKITSKNYISDDITLDAINNDNTIDNQSKSARLAAELD